MKFIWSLIVLSWTTSGITTLPIDEVRISEEIAACEDKGNVLFCDFKNSQQDIKYVEPLKTQTIEQVFIYSATKLHISDNACVNNITLHNVKGAAVTKSNSGGCAKKFELSATKSEFSIIHSNVNKLKLEDCKVEKLTTENELSGLSIISSNVNTLNIKGPLMSGTNVILQDSQIKTLEELSVNSGSSVVIQSTTIGNIKSNDFGIAGGRLIVKDSSIERANGGNISIEHFHGSATFSPAAGDTNRNRESLKTNENVNECQQNNVFAVLFVLCLVLLILSWILFLLYLNKELVLQKCGLLRQRMRHESIENEETKIKNTKETHELLSGGENMSDGEVTQQKPKQYSPITKEELITDHLKKLREMLETLKNENFLREETDVKKLSQEGSSDIRSQSDFQDYFYFLNELKNLQKNIHERLSKLKVVNQNEENVKKVLQSTKTLIRDKNDIDEYDFSSMGNSVSEIEIKAFAERVKKSETELEGIFQKMDKPMDKKSLASAIKNLIKSKGNELHYFVPASLYHSFLNKMSEIQTQCAQQYDILISKNMEYGWEIMILLLNVRIVHLILASKDADADK